MHLGRREFASGMTRVNFLKTTQDIGLGWFLSHPIAPWYMHAKSDVDLSRIMRDGKFSEDSIRWWSAFLSDLNATRYFTATLLHIVSSKAK